MTCLSLYSLAPKNGRTAKTLTCLAHGLKHSNFSRKTAHVLAKPAKCGKCLIYRCYLCTVFTPSSDFLNSTLGKKNEDSLAKPNLKSKKPHERILQTCGISAVNPPERTRAVTWITFTAVHPGQSWMQRSASPNNTLGTTWDDHCGSC